MNTKGAKIVFVKFKMKEKYHFSFSFNLSRQVTEMVQRHRTVVSFDREVATVSKIKTIQLRTNGLARCGTPNNRD